MTLDSQKPCAQQIADLYILEALFANTFTATTEEELFDLLEKASLLTRSNANIPYLMGVHRLQSLADHSNIEASIAQSIIADMDRAISLRENFPEALFIRSDMYATIGDLERSIADKEKFLLHLDDLDPILGMYDVNRKSRIERLQEMSEKLILQYHNLHPPPAKTSSP